MSIRKSKKIQLVPGHKLIRVPASKAAPKGSTAPPKRSHRKESHAGGSLRTAAKPQGLTEKLRAAKATFGKFHIVGVRPMGQQPYVGETSRKNVKRKKTNLSMDRPLTGFEKEANRTASAMEARIERLFEKKTRQ